MISSRLINRIVDSSTRREKSLDSFEDSSSKTETFFFSLSKRKRKVSPNSEKIFSNSSIKSRFEKFRRRLILRIESSTKNRGEEFSVQKSFPFHSRAFRLGFERRGDEKVAERQRNSEGFQTVSGNNGAASRRAAGANPTC